MTRTHWYALDHVAQLLVKDVNATHDSDNTKSTIHTQTANYTAANTSYKPGASSRLVHI